MKSKMVKSLSISLSLAVSSKLDSAQWTVQLRWQTIPIIITGMENKIEKGIPNMRASSALPPYPITCKNKLKTNIFKF